MNGELSRESPERWGWYSVEVTIVLVAINLSIAMVSRSLVVGAEAFHNLVDLLTSIAILAGLKFATRKSRTFPYGLYKLENILAVGLGLMIFYTAYEFIHDSIANPVVEKVIQPWMFGGLALVMVIPLVYSHFQLKAGRKSNSPALIASAKEFRTHVFTTGIAFISLITGQTSLPVEKIGVALIAIVIVKTGWELLVEGVRALLDASLSQDVLDQIRDLILADPAVANLGWLNGRSAGRVRFIEAGVELRGRDPEKIAGVLQRIENRIRESVPYVERVLIHAEAAQRKRVRYAIPLADEVGTLSQHFSGAPYFALVDLNLDDLTFKEQRLIQNPCITEEKARGIQVAEWLVEYKVDMLVSGNTRQGKGPGYVLENAGVGEQEIKASTLAEALAEIQANEHPT